MGRKKKPTTKTNMTLSIDKELLKSVPKKKGYSKSDFISDAIKEKMGKINSAQQKLETIKKLVNE